MSRAGINTYTFVSGPPYINTQRCRSGWPAQSLCLVGRVTLGDTVEYNINIYIHSWPKIDLMCGQRLLDMTLPDSSAESQRFMSADTNGHPHSHDVYMFLFFVYICVVKRCDPDVQIACSTCVPNSFAGIYMASPFADMAIAGGR